MTSKLDGLKTLPLETKQNITPHKWFEMVSIITSDQSARHH